MATWKTIQGLSRAKQAILAAAVTAVSLGMFWIVASASSERMSLLYSGLDASSAGDVIAELEQQGIRYELRSDTIFVPESERDLVRIQLAGEGLPRQSVQGYELLDSMSAFSTTSEMYNATYWRAKEGELTRTILAMPAILSARVHIAVPSRSGFSRNSAAPTASVTVSTSSRPDAVKAEALQYLIALSVPGMDPSEVVVIDARHGIIAGDGQNSETAPSKIASDRTLVLERRILNLLEARLGPGNARVAVNVEVDRDIEMTTTTSIDPESRVMRSRTTEEMAEDSQGGVGQITVASNLPQNADAQAGRRRATRENTRESVVYDFTETRTETQRLPGEIARVTVAAVLNAQALAPPDGTELSTAAQAEAVADFNALIAAVAGLNEARGDVLEIEIMPFSPVEIPELVPAPSLFEQMVREYGWSGAQLLMLALVIMVLGLGVIRPLLSRSEAGIDTGDLEEASHGNESFAPPVERDPVDILKEQAAARESEAANLLLDWLSNEPRSAANE